MISKFGSSRMVLVVGMTLLTIGILFYMLATFSWQKYQQYNNRAAQLTPKISRLLGVEDSYELLQQLNTKLQSQLTKLTYPTTKNSAMAAASMQRKVREAMQHATMVVSGSQIMPVKARDGYDKIGLDITAKGTIESLESLMTDLRALQPSIIIESINIKPIQVRRNQVSAQRISVRLKLFSLRLQS